MDNNLQNIEQIQELERELLREFLRICQEHDLHYYMAEGALLGAIRHQGIIPWDDDIDIAMFREDYERFLEIAPGVLGKDYELRNYRFQKDYKECMTKLVNLRRTVRSFAKQEPFDTNVWIDIFVIDGMPPEGLGRKLHKYRLLATKLMLMWSDVDHFAMPRKRPKFETFLIQVGRKLHLSKVISTAKWQKRLDNVMSSVSVKPDGDTVMFISEYKFRTLVPASTYGWGRTTSFDGITVSIPEQAEKLLTQVYRNYMQLPPEDQRYKHQLELLSASNTNQN